MSRLMGIAWVLVFLSAAPMQAQEVVQSDAVQPVEPELVQPEEPLSPEAVLEPIHGPQSLQSQASRPLPRNVAPQTITDDANGIIMTTGGAERMRITPAGNVGIGRSAPAHSLDVAGGGNFSDFVAAGSFLWAGKSMMVGSHFPSIASGQLRTASGSSALTGYLKIKLPQSWTNTMMVLHVDIFDYADGQGRSLLLTGYNSVAAGWTRTSVSQASNDNVPIRVEFGHDGTHAAIYLSKSVNGAATIWRYPQVNVRDFFAGYLGYGGENWAEGWSVEVTPTLARIIHGNRVKEIAGPSPSS